MGNLFILNLKMVPGNNHTVTKSFTVLWNRQGFYHKIIDF